MKVYLAGDNGCHWIKDNFFDFYRLESYLSIGNRKNHIAKYKDFILDSGIFSFLNGKDTSKVDWEKYTIDYADFVKMHSIKNYVEIDIDKMVGLDNVEKLRQILNKRVGWKCLPVWHMNRGYDKWLEICRDYDYICFGAFLTDGLKENKYNCILKFLADAKKENCKVHGLGFTNFKWLKVLKFYSVDSSSWTVGNRFGSLSKFTGDKIINIHRPKDTRLVHKSSLANHNFQEWIKYVEYADKYL